MSTAKKRTTWYHASHKQCLGMLACRPVDDTFPSSLVSCQKNNKVVIAGASRENGNPKGNSKSSKKEGRSTGSSKSSKNPVGKKPSDSVRKGKTGQHSPQGKTGQYSPKHVPNKPSTPIRKHRDPSSRNKNGGRKEDPPPKRKKKTQRQD